MDPCEECLLMCNPSARESVLLVADSVGSGLAVDLARVLERHHAEAHPAKNTGTTERHQAANETVSASMEEPFQMRAISEYIFGTGLGEHAGAMGGVGGNFST
jgi:hypothetical protein